MKMKRQTIEKTIRKKMEAWLDTITDEKLAKRIEKGLCVSGGCIASMLLGEKVNDYDVYLSDIDLVKDVAKYYTKSVGDIRILDGREKEKYIQEQKDVFGTDVEETVDTGAVVAIRTLKEDQIKLFIKGGGGIGLAQESDETKDKYVLLFASPNALTLSDGVQVVLRFYGDHTEIHKTYDFVHATNYFTMEEGLVTNTRALECLLSRTLIYQGSRYPLTSVIRSKKFINRGFTISAGEYLKMLFQISLLDLTNFDVLEEQLIGVDVAYFTMLIRALRNIEGKEEFTLTSAYLNEILDRIFNGKKADDDEL